MVAPVTLVWEYRPRQDATAWQRLNLFKDESAAFTREGIPTVCVDRVSRGYLLVDSGTFAWSAQATADA